MLLARTRLFAGAVSSSVNGGGGGGGGGGGSLWLKRALVSLSSSSVPLRQRQREPDDSEWPASNALLPHPDRLLGLTNAEVEEQQQQQQHQHHQQQQQLASKRLNAPSRQPTSAVSVVATAPSLLELHSAYPSLPTPPPATTTATPTATMSSSIAASVAALSTSENGDDPSSANEGSSSSSSSSGSHRSTSSGTRDSSRNAKHDKGPYKYDNKGAYKYDRYSDSSSSGSNNTSNSSSGAGGVRVGGGGGDAGSAASDSGSGSGSDGSEGENNGSSGARTGSPLLSATFEKKSKMTLRGTEFDAKGDVKTVSGVYVKSDLCATHELQPRDLRTIDNYRNQLPAILVRPSALIVNLEHVRALVKADMVLLFDTDNVDKHHQSMFVFDLQERLRIPSSAIDALPFELRAMEAILLSVCNVLRDQYNQLAPKVNALLRQMEAEVDRTTLVNVLNMSKKLTRFEGRVNSIQDAIMDILNSDEDMAGMYLTIKAKTGLSQPSSMHQEVEFMFEFYCKQIEEIQSQVTEMISNIRTTQSVVKITLDSQRNSLLLLELKITMGTFAVSLGALGCSAFGMNLQSGLEQHQFAFFAVAGTMGLIASSSFAMLLRHMRRLSRGYRS